MPHDVPLITLCVTDVQTEACLLKALQVRGGSQGENLSRVAAELALSTPHHITSPEMARVTPTS